MLPDNNPLTYSLTTGKPVRAWWLAALSTFDFHVQWRVGKKNQDVDGLSRWPHLQNGPDHTSEDEENRI